MDLAKVLTDLRQHKDQFEQTIASLKAIMEEHGGPVLGVGPSKRRRGRKAMGEDERQEVSRRMKRYWEGRRNQRVSENS